MIKPYRAGGAAMAVEDAAVLGSIFARITTKKEIRPLLEAYESIRLGRAQAFQRASRTNRDVNHYEDGPLQEERDRLMAAKGGPRDKEVGQKAHTVVSDQDFNNFAFGYDALEEVEKYWRRQKR
jgi:salicylate hydroxylase